jgi:hypothetical protein
MVGGKDATIYNPLHAVVAVTKIPFVILGDEEVRTS